MIWFCRKYRRSIIKSSRRIRGEQNEKLLLTGIAAASVFLLGACGSSNDTTTSAADKEEVIVGLDDTFTDGL